MTDMLTALSEHGQFDSTPRRRSRGRVSTPGPRLLQAVPSSFLPVDLSPADLLTAVDRKVIPRLHAALHDTLHRPRHPLVSGASALDDEAKGLAERMLRGDIDGAHARIDALRSSGHSLECIYLRLLAPAACHLRDLWSDDLCGLADATFAFCNLQSVLRTFAFDFYAEAACAESGSRVLLVAPNGDGADILTPMFGLVLMSHFFRRDGWDATIEQDLSSTAFRQTIGEWFDMVEVLAASDTQIDAIASGIRAIRRQSPNPSLGIVVCGEIFNTRPDYMSLVGADLMATDPLSSLVQARSFLKTSSQAKSFATHQTGHRRLA